MGCGETVFTETEKETGFTDTRVTDDEDFGQKIESVIAFGHGNLANEVLFSVNNFIFYYVCVNIALILYIPSTHKKFSLIKRVSIQDG